MACKIFAVTSSAKLPHSVIMILLSLLSMNIFIGKSRQVLLAVSLQWVNVKKIIPTYCFQ